MKIKRILGTLLFVGICCFIPCGCTIHLGTYHSSGGENFTGGPATISDKVSAIEVNWVSGEVKIEAHKEDTIQISEKASKELDKDTCLQYKLEGETLCIEYCKDGVNMEGYQKKLILKVPEGLELDEMDIDVVSANADVKDISAKTLLADTVSGEVVLDVPAVAEAKLNSVSGPITLKTPAAPESIEAGSVSGSITLELPKDLSATVTFSSISGRLISDLPGKVNGGTAVMGDGTASISGSTVSGNMRIKEY